MGDLFKKAYSYFISNCFGMKFGSFFVPYVNTH